MVVKYKLLIRKRDTKDNDPIEITFNNTKQIRYFIKNITTLDLNTKEYFFLNTNELAIFFYENYQEAFYTVNKRSITLNKMPNGFRREKVYNKKLPFNNNTLNKALKNIKKELEEHKVELEKGAFDNEPVHKFKLYQKENYEIVGTMNITFDKLLWVHKIDYVESQNPKEFINIVDRTIKKYTKSTHNARKRKYYANNS